MSTKELATWFWYEILDNEHSPWNDLVHFRRYLGEAKRVTKDYNADVAVLKEALLQMKQSGIEVKSMHLPITWIKPKTSMSWYEVAEEYLRTPPPCYHRHEFVEWCRKTGNLHLIKEL
jgi:hypothetical protein